MVSYVDVLKNNGFRNLWLAQITSQIALNMLIFVLGLHVYHVTRSNTSVSLILLSFGLPSIFFGIPFGSLVDFFDKKRVLVFCNGVRIFLIFLFFLFSQQILFIYLLSILTSIVTQLFVPAEGPSIAHLVKKNQLLSANSLFTISFYISTIVGFIFAGPALRLLGPHFIYLFMLVLMVLATYFVSRLPALHHKPLSNKSGITLTLVADSVVEGFRFIRNKKLVGQSLILMTFAQALLQTLVVLAPGFADKVVHIDLTEASYLVMGPSAVGLILGAFWVGRYGEKFLKRHIIRTSILGTGIVLLVLSVIAKYERLVPVSSILIFFILLIMVGFFNSLISVPASTVLQRDSETDVRGRVYGILTALTGGVSVLPVVFSGILADLTSVAGTLFVIAGVTLLIWFYEIMRNRKF